MPVYSLDRGWEDAIWRYDPWRRDAIALTWIGLAAALATIVLAELAARCWLTWAALGIELAAGIGWIVLLFATPP